MKDPIDRFMDKVFKQSNGCWIWIGGRTNQGYGNFKANGKYCSAHRWIYEYFNGPLGDLLCMHECNNPSCVNPDHLKSGTNSENMNYCVLSKRHPQSIKSHCRHGHEYSEENTKINKGKRYCRLCADIASFSRPTRKPSFLRQIKISP